MAGEFRSCESSGSELGQLRRIRVRQLGDRLKVPEEAIIKNLCRMFPAQVEYVGCLFEVQVSGSVVIRAPGPGDLVWDT